MLITLMIFMYVSNGQSIEYLGRWANPMDKEAEQCTNDDVCFQ